MVGWLGADTPARAYVQGMVDGQGAQPDQLRCLKRLQRRVHVQGTTVMEGGYEPEGYLRGLYHGSVPSAPIGQHPSW